MATRKTTSAGASSKRAAAAKKTKKSQRPGDPGDRVKQSASKIWLAGLGAFAAAEEEGGKMFRSMVERGKEFEGVGREKLEQARDRVEDLARVAKDRIETVTDDARDRAGETWQKVEKGWDERTAGTLKRLGVPTREEIARLTRRIEELTSLVEKKLGKTTASKKAPSKKAPSKKAPSKKAAGEKTVSKKGPARRTPTSKSTTGRPTRRRKAG